MKLKRFLTIATLSLVLMLTGAATRPCPDGINKLPMYGEMKKCAEQKAIDRMFLAECKVVFGTPQRAAQWHINRAWKYFYRQEPDSAMMRFNQAWLLDPQNADAFWGFGNIVGQRGQYQESLRFFSKSVKLNPRNPGVYISVAASLGALFSETRERRYLDGYIQNLRKSAQLDPKQVSTFVQLATAFTVCECFPKDSARKYMAIADQLDSNAVSPELRKRVME